MNSICEMWWMIKVHEVQSTVSDLVEFSSISVCKLFAAAGIFTSVKFTNDCCHFSSLCFIIVHRTHFSSYCIIMYIDYGVDFGFCFSLFWNSLYAISMWNSSFACNIYPFQMCSTLWINLYSFSELMVHFSSFSIAFVSFII